MSSEEYTVSESAKILANANLIKKVMFKIGLKS